MVANAYLDYNPDITVEKASDVLNYSQNNGLQNLAGQAHWLIGFAYIRQGVIGPDYVHIQNALDLAKELGDIELEVKSLRLMGVHYDYVENLTGAFDYLLESYNLAVENSFEAHAAIAKNNLGYILIKEGRPEDALFHLKTAVALSSLSGTNRNLALSLANYGIALSEIGIHEEGTVHLERAIEIAVSIENLAIIGYASQGLGMAQMRDGDLTAAKATFQSMINDPRLHSFPEYMLKTYLGLGELYLASDQKYLAEQTYRSGLLLMQGLSVYEPQIHLYRKLSEMAAERGAFEEAYQYELSLRAVRDLHQPMSDLSISEKLQSVLQNKDQEIALRESQGEQQIQSIKLEQQKLYVYVTALALLAAIFVLVILYLLYRSRRKSLAMSNIQNIKLLHQHREIKDEAAQLKNIIEAKSKIFENTSHDLRNPLSSIIGFVDLLNDEKLTETQKSYVSFIEQSTLIQRQLLNDILDLSQFEQGIFKVELRTDSFSHAFKPSISGWKMLADKNKLTLNVNISDELNQNYVAAYDRIIQVTGNLISNALKFTKKGQVDLSIELFENDKVKITVCDTGCGVAKEQLPKLFERFHQQNNGDDIQESGAGLGLSICSELVNHWGGELSATSTLGKGSCFWFIAPLEDSSR